VAHIIHSASTDPYFNLAMEEFLLHQKTEDFILIYANAASVVIGKHQNVFEECQIEFCRQNNIKIARRLSGGGTVYHGSGNINFSFIKNLHPGEPLVDFKKHLHPIIQFLKHLGVEAEFSGRNDLLVNGFKISGNAEHVFQKTKRLIHHGTLLFSANLDLLKGSTRQKDAEFTSHSIKSIRSEVKNIAEFVSSDMDELNFTHSLLHYLGEYFKAKEYLLALDDMGAVEDLRDEKYTSWDWIYGYTPTFGIKTKSGYSFRVKKGCIEEAEFDGEKLTAFVGQRFATNTFLNTDIGFEF